jgi:hypothetical protein
MAAQANAPPNNATDPETTSHRRDMTLLGFPCLRLVQPANLGENAFGLNVDGQEIFLYKWLFASCSG